MLVASLSYGVMNLVMVSTPLAMQLCGHPYASAAFVIEWHVIGMFAPGLVTGSIIGRVGIAPVIVAGGVLMLACIAIALSGVALWHFTVALFLLGVGWNFMYTGATTLLTTTYRAAEKNRVQGFNDACVFAVMATSSKPTSLVSPRASRKLISFMCVMIRQFWVGFRRERLR